MSPRHPKGSPRKLAMEFARFLVLPPEGVLRASCRPWLARLVNVLLTSSGLRNETLKDALRDMLGKPFGSANIVYVPTASVAESGDHGWFVADMSRLHGVGWREFDVLELNGLPHQMVLDRLLHADVVYVEGGSHYHLARSITGNDLADGFLEALESRVYVGVSGGSMIFSRNLTEHSAGLKI